MRGRKSSLRIISYEPQFQEAVADLFKEGLCNTYIDKGTTVVKLQQWFVQHKLSKDGDMNCIWDSYMAHYSEPSNNTPSTVSTPSGCLPHFWVAIDYPTNKVVGCVGVIKPEYKEDDAKMYKESSKIPF